jgi:hypothetical protein
MKLALAVFVAVLASALPAAADSSSTSTYELSATAGFDANGEQIEVSYSYQITVTTGVLEVNGGVEDFTNYSTTDLKYIVVDSAANNWAVTFFQGGGFSVSDGPLMFAGDLEDCCNGIYIDQELYNAQGPTGILLPQFWSAIPVETPEPSSLLLSGMGLAVLIGLASRNRTKGHKASVIATLSGA